LSEINFYIDSSVEGWEVTVFNVPFENKNHDVWTIKHGSVILADGATPLNESSPQNVAEWAQTFTNMACEHAQGEDMSLPQAWDDAIMATNRLFEPKGNTRTASVSHVRVGEETLDTLTLGDVKLCLQLSGGSLDMIFDDRVSKVEEKHPKGDLEGKELLKMRALQKAQVNKAGGFYAVADDPTVGSHAISHSLPTNTVQSIIIASDGFWRLFDSISVMFDATDSDDVDDILHSITERGEIDDDLTFIRIDRKNIN